MLQRKWTRIPCWYNPNLLRLLLVRAVVCPGCSDECLWFYYRSRKCKENKYMIPNACDDFFFLVILWLYLYLSLFLFYFLSLSVFFSRWREGREGRGIIAAIFLRWDKQYDIVCNIHACVESLPGWLLYTIFKNKNVIIFYNIQQPNWSGRSTYQFYCIWILVDTNVFRNNADTLEKCMTLTGKNRKKITMIHWYRTWEGQG